MAEKNGAAEPLSQLISSFEAASISKNKNSSYVTGTEALPTSLQLYQMGLVMHDLEQTHASSDLALRYQEWLAQVPFSYLKDVLFHDLNTAFVRVLCSDMNTALPAIKSVCSLYANSSLACRAGFSIQLCTSMASYYDKFQGTMQQQEQCVAILLRGLSALLQDGLLAVHDGDEEAHLERVMEVVRALTANEKSNFLGDLREWQQQNGSVRLQESIQSTFDDTPQRTYLLRMIESCPSSRDVTPKTPISASSSHQEVPVVEPTNSLSEIERRIQQVQEVLPDLGEGYIETALSCYQGDVSRTLAALLEGEGNPASLHPTLQVMDKSLPARRREAPKSSSYKLDDEEAKRITKSHLAEMEKGKEAEAYALSVMKSEYDDDYDDQYDGLDGGGTGGADVGMYDVDLDTIKTYNRAARAAEQEDSFWEENRNQNRVAAAKKQGGEGKYRGPDKGKGGRLIGPDGKYVPLQKGGKKGRQQRENAKKGDDSNNGNKQTANGSEDTMTNIQKRRKNKNKAKVANHHRKERAQKKAMGGL